MDKSSPQPKLKEAQLKKINGKLFSVFVFTLAIISSFIFLFSFQSQELKAKSTQLIDDVSIVYTVTIPESVVTSLQQVSVELPKTTFQFSAADIKAISFLFSATCLFIIFLLLLKVRRLINNHNKQMALLNERLLVNDNINSSELTNLDEGTPESASSIECSEVETEEPEKQIKLQEKDVYLSADLHFLASQKIAETAQIVFWKLPINLHADHQNSLLKSVLIKADTNIHITSWRQAFSTETIRQLLACAKTAKINECHQHIEVQTVFDDLVAIEITHVSDGWCGTIRNITSSTVLREENQLIKSENSRIQNKAIEREIEQSNKVGEMIVRSMLQSQSVSIGSGITSWQVYRQLTRIFDWSRQTKIRAQLQLPNQKSNLSSVHLVNELNGVALNVLADVQLQRNHFYLNCDESIYSSIEIDARLFNRMVVAICRLLLVEQFNATLTLSTEHIDRITTAKNRQFVRFAFSVETAQQCKKISAAVALLLSEGNEQLPDVIAYIQVLMKTLNVSAAQLNLLEQGYEFSFELELEKSPQSNSSDKSTLYLNDVTALYIANQTPENAIIYHEEGGFKPFINNLRHTHATIINAEEKELSKIIDTYLTHEALQKNGINLIVLDGRCYHDKYDGLYQHIVNLPIQEKPKLFVMQNTYNAPLHLQGLFSQGIQPLCQNILQQNIQALAKSDQLTNLVLSPEYLAPYRFLPTQVEVLLAVKQPENHQTLIRLLNWLGLHVQVVCQNVSMQKYWRSGRYLLLLTELNASPFIEFVVGKSIKRAIFTFNDQHLSRLLADKAESDKILQTAEVLADIHELPVLVEQLSPWLKSKKLAEPYAAAVDERDLTLLAKKPDQPPAHNMETLEQVLEDITSNKAILALFSESDELNKLDRNIEEQEYDIECCDLGMFANNQGSSALASFMFADYVQEIVESERLIDQNFTNNTLKQSADLFESIISNARIISAKKVLNASKELQLFINDNEIDNLPVALEQALQKIQISLKESVFELAEFERNL